ncbi:MAG: hypothetical protein E4H27_08880 [Anaerolineales bacterium]|nr:MAG: hypothetical protein E4H27_08880 [Anaerolineales bacterium]
MLPYDPVPWLLDQEGLPAVRARRILDLSRESDEETIHALIDDYATVQNIDGSFDGSLMKTAGILNLLSDLGSASAQYILSAGSAYLFSVLQSQSGYERARAVAPGSLDTPCDLCGFFGPYAMRSEPSVMASGAAEMNYYREYEPLMGPQSPVRAAPKSSYDRAGPSSCYAWGLIPLSYTIETLCRAGYAEDARLLPAINALLGGQRQSGGWCRNLGGHPLCSPHAIQALGAHPTLRASRSAQRALDFIRGKLKGKTLFAALQAVAVFDFPVARVILKEELDKLASKQKKNGTFGSPCSVEKVTAVLVARRALP